ncbi:YaaA family protein [Oceanirhabdus sp. W0125-5]|uniref:YaaA family protein n=1 Tax=Oceanirhabdus sp. W0125-5 TaxID=2999116 RepID=UPI0022F2AB0F|nr:peroxide stress protein YaaA [Oceanirhabdus sp. W0125-5]WBW98178.1 peroxide stress protein YaaA [Oceanirhabdus sp. W0125-5]
MKIIVSPSKTQQFDKRISYKNSNPKFQEESLELRKILKYKEVDEIARIMKIKGKKLEEVVQIYQTLPENLDRVCAIEAYTGFVFKELNIEGYSEKELDYMDDKLRILSALYGILKPFDVISPYRLDMTMKISDESLYSLWTERITQEFSDEELIVNLASKEFSKLVKRPMLTIDFKVIKDGKLKTVGTYAKKARGMMLHYLISNKIEEVGKIKEFDVDGYCFSEEHSDEDNWTFVKKHNG